MIIKILIGLVKIIFMIAFFPIILILSLFSDKNCVKQKKKKNKKRDKTDDLAWIDRLEELDALIDD
ncbi:hypothetical protein [Fenollaria massiliensis]|uniref:Uncharacterized protein n=1 Tax=Fenollaria massiliensis TaxID=938288 RepID=A0A9E7IUG2_9FIRM|nr:hypothetical protein [Fenollaria massiliensis]UQK58569.1 hypothetical protein M1R53_04845 [Fenollaria massiliensis]